jgi:hypothetical protein
MPIGLGQSQHPRIKKIQVKSYNRRNGFGKERDGLFTTACFL